MIFSVTSSCRLISVTVFPFYDITSTFQELLREQGIICRMSRAGEVWDNSAMERFFSSLKTEKTAKKVYRTHDQARVDVFDYIEAFYNRTRRHSHLGDVSPEAFERASAWTTPHLLVRVNDPVNGNRKLTQLPPASAMEY